MNLELAAMRWLWLEKNCHYVLEQRSPRYHLGEPDVLGVTAGRFLIEIEIKRSVSDFKADASKHHRSESYRRQYSEFQPKQIYYLVPEKLVAKVLPLVPEWAGLMKLEGAGCRVFVEKVAPNNDESKNLSIKDCVKLARCMTNHMMSYAQHSATHTERFLSRDDLMFVDWDDAAVGTYQI